MKPNVSVCIFTYNHEKYIQRCIESVLMQKTNFDFEIIIGEDYSKDKTKEICIEYASKYPNKIRLLDRGKNLGICENIFQTLKESQGDYIALLDGDDYWIDPMKLQKQYDFLEKENTINMVFHQTLVINKLNNTINLFVKNPKLKYTLSDIINKWSMATGSMFFRTKAMDFPDFVYHTHNVDLIIQLIVNRNNEEIGYIDDLMSVYYINEGSNTNNPNYNALNTAKRQKLLFEEYNEYTNFRYNELIIKSKKWQEIEKTIKNKGKNRKGFIKYKIKKIINSFGFNVSRIN